MRHLYALIVAGLMGMSGLYAQYCLPTYTTGVIFGDSITSIQVANLTGNFPGNGNSYNNFTSLATANLQQGQTYTITIVNNPTWSSGVSVWIDYNFNNVFDPAELLGSTLISGGATGTITFTVPVTALPGVTRMRMTQTFAFIPTDPCGTYTYGETEDYAVSFPAGSADDVAATGLVNFELDCQAFTGIPITLGYANIGTSAADTVILGYSVNGGAPVYDTVYNVPSLTTGTLTFSQPAVLPLPTTFYNFQAWVSYNGDLNASNDTFNTTFLTPILQAIPFSEDFETFTVGSPGSLNNGWTTSGGSGFNGWFVNAGPTPTFGSGPVDDHTQGGNGVYMYTENGFFGANTYSLFSPCIDLGSSPGIRLSFWYHMFGPGIGTLEVYVVAGGTATQVWSLSGQQQTSEADDWEEGIVDLTAYAGENVKIEFRASGGFFQGDMAIDDVLLYKPAAIDAGVAEVVSPIDPACYGANEPVTVRIQNLGNQPLDMSVNPVTVTLNVSGAGTGGPFTTTVNTGTLPVLGTQDVQVTTAANLAAPGFYILSAFTSVTGDPNAFNDTTQSIVESLPVFTAPYNEDFESFSFVFFAPGTLNNGWTRSTTNVFNPNTTWSVGNGPTLLFGTGPAGNNTPTGVNYMYTQSLSAQNTDTLDLVSPCIDLAGLTAPKLKFFYHMFGATMGTMEVGVLVGTAYTPIWSISGQQQTAETDPWTEQVLNLTPFAGQTVRLVFRGLMTDNFQSDMAIDDVSVFEPAAIDVLAGDIVSPVPSCGLGTGEIVSMEIINFGTDTLTNMVAQFQVDNGAFTTPQAVPGVLLPGDTVIFTFTALANLSTPGSHTITAVATQVTPPDGDPTNDTTSLTLFNFGSAVSTFPYFQNFESGQGGWTSSGQLNSWAFGTPAKSVIQGASSGVNAWVTGGLGFGPYNNNEQSAVTGPCFDFTNIQNPVIELDIWWASEGFFDGAVLQASTDGGVTWDRVGDFGDPDNWYNWQTLFGNPGGQQQGWGGSPGSGGYVTAKHKLDGLGGLGSVLLRIAFGADGSVTFDGFAFDNIRIYEIPPFDASFYTMESPVNGCGLTNAETVTIQYGNTGTQPFSSVNVSYQVNNGPVVTETANINLNPGDTATYTFTTPANLSAVGVYNFDFWVVLAGDTLQFNDSLFNQTAEHIITVSTFPYVQDFETSNGGWNAGGSLNSWALGTPAKATITGAASGVNAWVNGGLTGSYNNSEQSYVLGPCFDFTTLTDPVIEMNIWWECETSWDGAVLQSSINNGATWQTIGDFGDPFNWYTDNTVNGNPGGSQEAWSGYFGNGSNGWVPARHTLTGLAGQSSVQLRIAFGADGSVVSDGFAFDDIQIYNRLAQDGGLVQLLDPEGQICDLDSAEVIVQISNYGSQPLVNIPVQVQFSGPGGFTYNATIPGPLPSDSTNTYNLGSVLVSTPGTYTVTATTDVTGDTNVFNDSSQTTLVVNPTYAAPLALGDSVCATDSASFTLIAQTAAPLVYWYDAPTGGNIVHEGDTFQTPFSQTSVTYYAEASSALLNSSFSPADNTFGGGSQYFFFGDGLVFDVFTDMRLISLKVYPGSAGDITINLLDPNGISVLQSETFAFGGTVPDTTLTLNWEIPVGSSYQINTDGSTVASFFRNNAGAVFPYVAPGIMALTNTINGLGPNGFYYFFYDWNVSTLGCPSPRVPVTGVILDPIDVDLGPDGAQCSGYVLDAFDPAITSYLWSNGATTPSITVTTTGLYYVNVTNADGCTGADSATLIINPSPVVDLGNDTAACGSVTLSAGNPGAQYFWSNGATTQTVTLTQSGTYTVAVTSLGCVTTDTVNVTINAAPVVELGPNVTTCQPVTLSAGNPGATYLWSTGETTQSITVQPPAAGQAANVSVSVTNAAGCVTTDNIIIAGGTPPVVNLGADLTVCDSTQLTANVAGATYLWSTGATTQSIWVTQSGSYSVVVADAQGCQGTDEVTVTVKTKPVADFTYSQAVGGTLTFTNTSTPLVGVTVSWDFGDGNTSNALNPTNVYTFPSAYDVSLTVTNECGSSTKVIRVITFGVSVDDELFARMIQVYPNPTEGEIEISGTELKAERLTIEVYDPRGRVVYNETLGRTYGDFRHKADLSRYAEGVYLIKVSDGERTAYIRVMHK